MKYTDHITTAAGAAAALAMLSQIDFTAPGWWKQSIVAVAIIALGYFTNKNGGPGPTATVPTTTA